MFTKKVFKIVVTSKLMTGSMRDANGLLFDNYDDAVSYADRLIDCIVFGSNRFLVHRNAKHSLNLLNEPCYRRQCVISEFDDENFEWYYLYELSVLPYEICVISLGNKDEGAS